MWGHNHATRPATEIHPSIIIKHLESLCTSMNCNDFDKPSDVCHMSKYTRLVFPCCIIHSIASFDLLFMDVLYRTIS